MVRTVDIHLISDFEIDTVHKVPLRDVGHLKFQVGRILKRDHTVDTF